MPCSKVSRALPQRVELGQRIGVAGRAHRRSHRGSLDRLRQAEALAGQRLAHVVGAALVELVDLAQHQPCCSGSAMPWPSKKPRISLRLLSWMVNSPIASSLEHRVDHRRDLGVVADRQRILADHVDVALVELAEAAALGALAAVDALDLVAAERESSARARARPRSAPAARSGRSAAPVRAAPGGRPSPARRWTARNRPGARSRRRTWSAAPRTAPSPASRPAGSRSARSCARIVSSMRWKAIWSRGSSSMTPGGVRGLIKPRHLHPPLRLDEGAQQGVQRTHDLGSPSIT
jgi:hypothetical protein